MLGRLSGPTPWDRPRPSEGSRSSVSQASTAASLVRVSVSSGTRRADLGVPGGIPVVELVPELARELGVLDAGNASHGFRLVARRRRARRPRPQPGRPGHHRRRRALARDRRRHDRQGLRRRRRGGRRRRRDPVRPVDRAAQRRHRDRRRHRLPALRARGRCSPPADTGLLVAAVAGRRRPPPRRHRRRARGAHPGRPARSPSRPSRSSTPPSPGSRCSRRPRCGARGWSTPAPRSPSSALLAAAALPRHRLVLAAGAVVGAAMVVLGRRRGPGEVSMTTACAVVFVVAVVLGNVLPWVGISSSRLSSHAPRTEAEIGADAPEVDRGQVRAQVARGHDVMVGRRAGHRRGRPPHHAAARRGRARRHPARRRRPRRHAAAHPAQPHPHLGAARDGDRHPRPGRRRGRRRAAAPDVAARPRRAARRRRRAGRRRSRCSPRAPASGWAGSPTPSTASCSSPCCRWPPPPSGCSEPMATKKDLVEAQSFSRRRLTTAFVSGAPGGREVEPHRPLRAVAGGLALTVVLVLGSMAFGWLRSSLPADWENNRLIIAEDSGARYVSIKGVLHPVVNTTSARLLIPADEFKVLAVPDDELASIDRGPTLGILGAPDSLTPPDRLVNSGWVACLGSSEQVSTAIGGVARATPVERGAVVVRTDERTFVVADGRRYPVADARRLGRHRGAAPRRPPRGRRPAAWLNLFPEGPALAPLTIDGLGTPLPGLPAGATVGSVLTLDGDGRRYVVLPERRPRAAARGRQRDVPARLRRLRARGPGPGRRRSPSCRCAPSGSRPPEWPDGLPHRHHRHPVRDAHRGARAPPPEVTLGSTHQPRPDAGRGRAHRRRHRLRRAGAGGLRAGAQQGPGARRRPDRHGLRARRTPTPSCSPAWATPRRRRAGAAGVDRAAALGAGARRRTAARTVVSGGS